MRFVILLAAALAAAAPCSAATITAASITSTHGHSLDGIATVDGWVQLGNTTAIRWTIPNLTQADVGTIYTVTEANAADYAFDWSFAEIFMRGTALTSFTLYAGSVIGGDEHGVSQVFRGPATVLENVLVDFQFRIVNWGSNSLQVVGTVNYFAPEPSSFLLVLIGLAGVTCIRRR